MEQPNHAEDKYTAKYKCGEPYSGIANGFLFLEDDSLRYVYWRNPAQSPAAYSSKKEIIRSVQ